MICEFCGGETTLQKVNKLHSHREQQRLIKNVPARVCQKCGEHYYHAKVLDEIDRLLDTKQPIPSADLVDKLTGSLGQGEWSEYDLQLDWERFNT
jgi:YgiT-type zinc finger domain-containing protein